MNSDHYAFVNDWLDEHHETSCVDQLFHEAFLRKFGGKYKAKNWGAQPAFSAMKVLKEMYKQGLVSRSVVGLGKNWQPGFPKWVYSYTKK